MQRWYFWNAAGSNLRERLQNGVVASKKHSTNYKSSWQHENFNQLNWSQHIAEHRERESLKSNAHVLSEEKDMQGDLEVAYKTSLAFEPWIVVWIIYLLRRLKCNKKLKTCFQEVIIIISDFQRTRCNRRLWYVSFHYVRNLRAVLLFA